MARKKAEEKKETFKEFKFDGKEFAYTGRVYPDLSQETKNATITPVSLTLNGLITIKGCKLWQTDNNSWLRFPEYQDKNKEYKSYVYTPKELNEELDKLVEAIEGVLD